MVRIILTIKAHFFKISVLKNFADSTGKHLCWSFFLIKLQALRPVTLLKTDQHTCFPMKLVNFLRTIFFYRKPPVAASENNEQQQLSEGLANICCKTVSPILLQEFIKDFVVCKHCSRTLLLVEDVTSCYDFGKWNYIFQIETTLFNRLTQNMPHFYVALHKVYIFQLVW